MHYTYDERVTSRRTPNPAVYLLKVQVLLSEAYQNSDRVVLHYDSLRTVRQGYSLKYL